MTSSNVEHSARPVTNSERPVREARESTTRDISNRLAADVKKDVGLPAPRERRYRAVWGLY